MQVLTEPEIRVALSELASTNARLLKIIQAQGCSLDKTRQIDHQFRAFNEQEAALLAKTLEDSGEYISVGVFTLEDEDSEDSENEECSEWSVEATASITPLQAASDVVTEKLVRLAAKFNATYDGWGTELD